MTLSKQQCIFCKNVAKLLLRANELGYDIKIQELNRTLETQKEYVKTGKSKTLNSKHLDKLAADIVLFKDDKLCEQKEYRVLGEYWETLGGRWGGRFHNPKLTPNFDPKKDLGWDTPHFEYQEGMC